MYVGRLLCVPSLLLASCLYLLKDLPWPCTASCCCCCCSGGGGGGSQGKGRARREHLRMTAGVQLHGVTSVSRGRCTALFRQARSKCWAARGAPVCVCRGERNLSIAGRRKGGHHYGLISKITSKIFWSSSKCCMCNSEYATWNFG